MSQSMTAIRLHLDKNASVAVGKSLASLVAWFESPYFDFLEYLTFTVTDSCDWCATNQPRPPSFTLPDDVEEALCQGAVPSTSTAAGMKPQSPQALIDEHFERALGPRAPSIITKMEDALQPDARFSVCMQIDDDGCEELSLVDFWWWAISRTVGGPSETYRREHAQAEHRFVVSARGDGRQADIRIFLPTRTGAHLRSAIAAVPHIVAVPQSLLAATGRLLPEAQPYLLPVLGPSFGALNETRPFELQAGYAEELSPGERRAAKRAWRSRGKASETLAMKIRDQLNRLVGILYGSPTLVRILRVPSQMFPRLSRTARTALTSVGYRAPNPYLTDAEAQKLAVDVWSSTK